MRIAAARRAFDEGPWPRLAITERIALLRRFTDARCAPRGADRSGMGAECGPTAAFR